MKRIDWMTKKGIIRCSNCYRYISSDICCKKISTGDGYFWYLDADDSWSSPQVRKTGDNMTGELIMGEFVSVEGDWIGDLNVRRYDGEVMAGAVDMHTTYPENTFMGVDWAHGEVTAFKDMPTTIEDNFVTKPVQYPAG